MDNTAIDGRRTAALDGVDFAALHQRRREPTPWTLEDVKRELDLSKWVTTALWRTTSNYLYGGHREWPPRGPVTKVRLPDVGEPVADPWWPPDAQLLPPPDVPSERAQPRWRAGTIWGWAVQVGRVQMDTLLPVPLRPGGAGKRRPAAPDISDISLAAVHRMVADDTLWTIKDIERFFGVTQEAAQRWAHCTRNRIERGVTTWPPTRAETLRKPVERTGDGLRWWPNHLRLLPPPHSIEGGYRWRAGDVKRWGLQVGKLLPDGRINHWPGTISRSRTPRAQS